MPSIAQKPATLNHPTITYMRTEAKRGGIVDQFDERNTCIVIRIGLTQAIENSNTHMGV